MNGGRYRKGLIYIFHYPLPSFDLHPFFQVATLWWVFNGRILWDKANTLASEVVEEYGKNCRLVYIKGAPKPMISSRDFVFVSHK